MPSVGTAYVNIRVNTKGFESSLDKMLARMSAKMDKAGQDMGKDFERGLAKSSGGAFKPLTDASDKAATHVTKNFKTMGDAGLEMGADIHQGSEDAASGLSDVSNEGDSASSSMGGVNRSSRSASRSLSQVSRSADRAGRSLASGGNGSNIFSQGLSNLASHGRESTKILNSLYRTEAFLGTALAGLVGGLSAAAQGIFAVGANAAAAAPSLAIMANGLMSLAQVGGVVGLAMSSVGSALTAGMKTVAPAAATAGKAATGMGAATASAARAIRDAKQALSRAYQDAARAAADAAQKVKDAEHALALAQVEAKAAQEALTAARKEGAEQMEDIAFAAQDASLSERQAALDLADAQQRLAEVSELAPDDRARVEAQLAFEQADLQMKEATDRRQDADEAQRKAAESGVEGTEAVTSAQQDLADAQKAASDAARDLADARKDEARTAVDSAQRISDAQQAVADAQAQAARAQQAGAAATTKAAKAVDLYQQELAKLGPEQRAFVERIVGMHDEFVTFRNEVTAPVFASLLKGMDTIAGSGLVGVIQKGLTGTATALGDVVEQAAGVAASPAFKKSLGDAMEDNNKAIGHFGSAAVHLADAFVQVADAGGPLFRKFSRWVDDLTKSWAATARAKNGTGELSETIRRGAEHVEDFWRLAKELWHTIAILGRQANKASNQFKWFDNEGRARKGYIPSLIDSLRRFNKQLDTVKGRRKTFDGFTQSLHTLSAAGRALKRAVINPLIEMGQDKGLQEAFDTIGDNGPVFERLADNAGDAVPKMADLVVSIADILADLSDSGSIDHFLTILNDIAWAAGLVTGALNKTPLLKWIGWVTAALAAWKLFTGGLRIFFSPWAALTKGVIGYIGKVRTAKAGGKGFFGSLTAGFKKNPAQNAEARTAGQSVTDSFAEGIRAGLPEKDAAMAALQANVEEKLVLLQEVAVPKANLVGVAIVEGLAAGIREGTAGVTAAAEVAGREVATAVSTGAQTRSPSRLTIPVGIGIIEGVAVGMEEAVAPAEAAALAAGAEVGGAVGVGAKEAAATSTAGLGATIGTSVAGEVDAAAANPKVAGSVGKFGKVFAGAGKVMSGAMRGIGGAMNFMMGPWGLLIMILLPLLMPLLKKLNDKFHITEKVMDALGWAVQKLGDFFIWLWDVALKPLFEWLAEQGGKVWESMQPGIDAVTAALGWFWDKIKSIFGWLKSNWPLVLGIITGPIGLAVVLVIKYWDQILGFVKGVPGKIRGFLSGLWDAITEKLQSAWDTVQAIWGRIVNWVQGRPEQFTKNLKALWNIFSSGLHTVWGKVQEIWGRIVAWIKGRPDQFMNNLRLLWDIFRSALSKAYTAVKGIWTKITTWVKGRPAQFKSNMSALWDVFKDKLDAAWEYVKTKWLNIKGTVSGWGAEMAKKMSNLWDGLGTGLVSAINWVGEKVNWLIDQFNKLTGTFGGPSIDFDFPTNLTFNGYAHGGPVRGPGGPRDDRIPARLSAGEHVLTAAEVKAMGGHANVTAMRKSALRGGPPEKLGRGGIVGSVVGSITGAFGKGAEYAMKWILNKFGGTLDNSYIGKLVRGVIDHAADKLTSWGAKKDEALAGQVAYPVPKGTSTYNFPGHHPSSALDMGVGVGTAVKALMGGKVASINGSSRSTSSYGLWMILDHGDGWKTLYAHLSGTSVGSGAMVKAGQQIARSGASGGVSGPHLHLEVTKSPGSAYSDTHAELVKRKILYPYAYRAAKGGVFSPTDTGTLTLLAEAGKSERVTPLDSEGFTPAERRILESLEAQFGSGGGGDTYHVHPSQKMNEAQLADMVARRVAWKRRRGGGSR